MAERHRPLFEILDSDLVRTIDTGRAGAESPSQVEFFVLNYSMASFRAKYHDNMHMDKVRINFAPHAYMFSGCQPGDTRQVNINVALYTQQNQESLLGHLCDANLHGVEECCSSDHGRMAVNPYDFLGSSGTLHEVHLHPVDDSDQMAVSPNNCAFLLNLTLPAVNFFIVMLHNTEGNLPKLSVLNVTFLNEEAMAECAILCALNSEMLLQSITAEDEKREDLESLYLKRLKHAIEQGVLAKMNDNAFVDSLFSEQ